MIFGPRLRIKDHLTGRDNSNESLTNDPFYGIDELVTAGHRLTGGTSKNGQAHGSRIVSQTRRPLDAADAAAMMWPPK